MLAMCFCGRGQPLRESHIPLPEITPNQVLIRVRACGVCRTDLHLVDGDLPNPKPAVIPGHEVIGVVERVGERANRFAIGQRVGVPWLGWTCGECRYCLSGQENLCDRPKFTGYTLDGGYAEYVAADANYCFAIPEGFGDAEAAPLLCAGLIGYRSLVMAGDASRLGIYAAKASAGQGQQNVRGELTSSPTSLAATPSV